MIRFLIICCFLCFQFFANGQVKVVEWDAELIKNGEVSEVQLTASIMKGWKLYSQHTEEGGPIPTTFTFEFPETVRLEGEVVESGEFNKEYSELFEIDVTSVKQEAKFIQRLSHSTDEEELVIKIRYMSCDGLKCIPPTTETITLKI
jgi:thiol:disulfide interchange protein DsbD